MLRELPETELSDDSDYERWYFEEQRAAWEAKGTETQKGRAGRKLNELSAYQRGAKRETLRYGLSPLTILTPLPL